MEERRERNPPFLGSISFFWGASPPFWAPSSPFFCLHPPFLGRTPFFLGSTPLGGAGAAQPSQDGAAPSPVQTLRARPGMLWEGWHLAVPHPWVPSRPRAPLGARTKAGEGAMRGCPGSSRRPPPPPPLSPPLALPPPPVNPKFPVGHGRSSAELPPPRCLGFTVGRGSGKAPATSSSSSSSLSSSSSCCLWTEQGGTEMRSFSQVRLLISLFTLAKPLERKHIGLETQFSERLQRGS